MTEIPAMESIIYDEIRVLPGPPDQYPTPPTTERSRTASPDSEKSVHDPTESSEEEELLQPEKPAPKQRPTPPPPRVSTRLGKGQHTPHFGEASAMLANANPDDEPEPTTYQEAINHPTRGMKWEDAFMEEYQRS